MKAKITAAVVVMGALLLPVTGQAQNKEADKARPVTGQAPNKEADKARSSPKVWVKDSVITAKIKADYAADKQVSAMRINVDTDAKGMVELSGTARSKAEADKAVSIAKSVKGVVSVDNQIKIVPSK